MPPQLRTVDNSEETTTTTTNTMRRVVSESEISVSSPDSPSSSPESKEYRVRKSSLIGMIDWTHVIGTHAPQLMTLGMVVLFGQIVHQVVTHKLLHDQDLKWYEMVNTTLQEVHGLFLSLYSNILANNTSTFDLLAPYVKITALLLLIGAWLMRFRRPVYLLSFATFKAPDSWKVSHDQIVEIMDRQKCFSDESLKFMNRILERSGTGQATAWPPGITKCLTSEGPSDRSMEASRKEFEAVVFPIVEEALKKANCKPRDIDVLIINCSLFSPTPSLCAMVLSHFGMRSDVATYNLSGMGCSASLISVDLAQTLLMSGRYKKALVVSTEILTPAFYHGNERGFLIQNTLFRCGGAALVLSNRWHDGRRAWYKLLHTIRVQGTGEAAYQCVYQGEDTTSNEIGVRLSKDIVKVAGKCMEKNFTMLGPEILPWSEQAAVVFSIALRYIQTKWLNSKEPTKPYVPDFKTAIDHFCIHAGGRAVIDGIEKNMKLQPYHTEASRMTLLNYGNTSSSSIWYELEYIQEHQKSNRLRKGDRILQVAFGSGFKCTSGVWLKL